MRVHYHERQTPSEVAPNQMLFLLTTESRGKTKSLIVIRQHTEAFRNACSGGYLQLKRKGTRIVQQSILALLSQYICLIIASVQEFTGGRCVDLQEELDILRYS
ncbi:hypothetical protein CEXT_797241 [Caerostris extrusa]|uniref:Uncharacterized protein n=1 Tax=Caerostris extrusa TaxID=172846 RepID=A0AAV4RB53_CAEEX|nr:hypothetical protein CEXT_797241 [Caerostris extrusa]